MDEDNIITLNDENGNEVEFEFLDLIPYRQICIYFFTVAISLSPLGEMCLAAFAGASDIKRVKNRRVPKFEKRTILPTRCQISIMHPPFIVLLV